MIAMDQDFFLFDFYRNDLIRSRSCHDFDITYGGLLSQQMIDQIETTALFGFTFFPNHTAINRSFFIYSSHFRFFFPFLSS